MDLRPDGPAGAWPGTGSRRFRGKQESKLDRLGETLFLSREHIDWSRTRAYAQGNFGQIFLNLKGRQPNGCVDRKPTSGRCSTRSRPGLLQIPHPETGEPLVERVYERDELYHGPYADQAPDLTVVLEDWTYRTIGLHDFTTHKLISPAFGPTGDHRMEGVLVASGAGDSASAPRRPDANLLDIAPTVLHLLGVPVPADMDGRVLSELLTPEFAATAAARAEVDPDASAQPVGSGSSYSSQDDAAIQDRLADLGYL